MTWMSEVDVELMKKFRDFIMHVVKRDSITAFCAFDEILTGFLDISESKKSALEYDFKGDSVRVFQLLDKAQGGTRSFIKSSTIVWEVDDFEGSLRQWWNKLNRDASSSWTSWTSLSTTG